jgi:hypothetical protein
VILGVLGVSITGFVMHLKLGSVDWRLVALLMIGSVSGAFIGPMLLKRIDKKKLERIMQPILLVIVIAMGLMQVVK